VHTPYQHDNAASFPSSYADGGFVQWSTARMDPSGRLIVHFPKIRWDHLRKTEGWAALQYHALLHSTFTVRPPANARENPIKTPQLSVDLLRGSFFAIFPFNQSKGIVQEWHAGNIYEITGESEAVIDLPGLSWTEPTCFHILVSGDYEIRLFGDPSARSESDPALDIRLTLDIECPGEPIRPDPRLHVYPDSVDGYLFGDTLGVGVQSTRGNWELVRVDSPEGIELEPRGTCTLVPGQTRQLSLTCRQTAVLSPDNPFISFTLIFQQSTEEGEVIITSRPFLFEIPFHTLRAVLRGSPILGTHYHAGALSFLAVAPKEKADKTTQSPIIFLHGAGVDITTFRSWAKTLSQQKSAWILAPTGRTSWGFDWRGPSALSVWSALEALASITHKPEWEGLKFAKNTKVVVVGHSNGGQGTWYLASRFPDRVIGAIPAAGYIKAQSYIPTSLSRLDRFIDPALRGILNSSLSTDDNDLHLSNLVDTPILAIHGGLDENVPTWHSRELISLLKSRNSAADASFVEVPDKPHWWSTVFDIPQVQQFIDRVQRKSRQTALKEFTLTVCSPAESGSMKGFVIEKLSVPGRLGRLHVQVVSSEVVRVSITNVRQLKLPHNLLGRSIECDGDRLEFPQTAQANTVTRVDHTGPWKLSGLKDNIGAQHLRVADILNTSESIRVVYMEGDRHSFRVALRLSRVLSLYLRIDTQIVSSSDYNDPSSRWSSSRNVVVLSKGKAELPQGSMSARHIELSDDGLKIHGRAYREPGIGALILSSVGRNTILHIWGNDDQGLEYAARLFPFRTGLACPEWIVLGDIPGAILAAGFWGHEWMPWNEAMSWLS